MKWIKSYSKQKKITSSGTISCGEELLDSDFPLPFTITSDSEDGVDAENIKKCLYFAINKDYF